VLRSARRTRSSLSLLRGKTAKDYFEMASLVSVVIPTCNDDLRLEWVLEGLCNQTVSNFEVIVVNDDGEKSTGNLVRGFRDRLRIQSIFYEGPKLGQRAGATRNHGVKHSCGDLLLFLDTDVIPDPDVVEAHATAFNPGFSYFGFRRHYPMHLVHPFSPPMDYEHLLAMSHGDNRLIGYSKWDSPVYYLHFFGCNYSVPTEMYCALGGHDERFVGWGGEDIDLGFRITRYGGTIYPLWGIGVGTHLDHPQRPLPTIEQRWHCDPDEPLCRNGKVLRRLVDDSESAISSA
jgi:validoxylamine A glucosyltransferase